jgi:methionyl-tRNA synthetase
MLWGVGLPVFETVAAHGWILLGGEKISKSKGNVIRPLELAQELSERSGCAPEIAIDVVRYYVTSTMGFETDSVFTYEDFDRRYNSDLANDLGNALNRSLAMSQKFVGSIVPDAEPESEALAAIAEAKAAYEAAFKGYRLDRAATAAWSVVRFLNKYIDTRAPWALAKANDPALGSVLRSMLVCLRAAEGLVRPYIPATADAMAGQLGLPPVSSWDQIGSADSVPAGTKLGEPKPIFPRLETKPIAQQPKKEKPAPKMEATPAPTTSSTPADSLISIEDFAKVQLRVARILEAEPLEGADKLLKVQVVIGNEKRQIVAGIRQNYTPEDLIGRQIVVVYNLKPAKLRGVESQGMLLAAVDESGGAILLQPDKETPEGAKVR